MWFSLRSHLAWKIILIKQETGSRNIYYTYVVSSNPFDVDDIIEVLLRNEQDMSVGKC